MGDVDWRKRKRHREGNIMVKAGLLYARVQYLDERTGQRKEKVRRADNRTHARTLIKQMRSELTLHGQQTLETDKATFGQVADKYSNAHMVEAVYQNGIKVAGRRSLAPLKSSLKPVRAYFGRKMIRAIRPSDIQAYKVQRLNTPVEIRMNRSPQPGKSRTIKADLETISRPRKIASVNRELELIRAIFNFAKAEDLVAKSPFDNRGNLISTAAEVERDRVMSFDEEKRLLTVCTNRKAHLRPIVIVAVDTAMRRGELFKLRWTEVSLATGEITILASNSKTEKARRVGLTSRAKMELSRLWSSSPRQGDELVFGVTCTIKNAWKSACSEAGIEDLRFHDLRHTATTRLVRSGVPASEVMKLTGHSQTRTFLRYLNLTNESVSASATMLDNLLRESDSPITAGSLQEFSN